MKKLIVAAALIACAVSAQAAQITWGASAALTTIKSGTMYCMYAKSGTTLDWSKLGNKTFTEQSLLNVGFTKKIDSFNYIESEESTVTKVTRAGGSSGVFSPKGAGLTQGNYNLYYALISDDGKEIMYMTSAKSVPFNDATNSKNVSALPSLFTYKAADVPEPTSAMLLLLGMAGLALRRRRA